MSGATGDGQDGPVPPELLDDDELTDPEPAVLELDALDDAPPDPLLASVDEVDDAPLLAVTLVLEEESLPLDDAPDDALAAPRVAAPDDALAASVAEVEPAPAELAAAVVDPAAAEEAPAETPADVPTSHTPAAVHT